MPEPTPSVLLTGATGSLGRSIVPALATEFRCVVTYRSAGAWNELRAGTASPIEGTPSDLASRESVESAFRAAAPVRAVVHLAGGWSGGSLVETDDATWKQALEVNLDPAFRVLRTGLAAVQEGGSIVLVSSLGAQQLRGGMAAYVTAKSALETLTRLAAVEGSPRRLRVNAIAPDTIGQGPGTVHPDRILEVIRFLLRDESAGISGSIIPLPAAPQAPS